MQIITLIACDIKAKIFYPKDFYYIIYIDI